MVTPAVLVASFLLAPPQCSVKNLARDLNAIAGPGTNGRMTLSPEMTRTADYLAKALRKAGLQPAGENGTYFQDYAVTVNRRATVRNVVDVLDPGPSMSLQLGRDFVPMFGSADMRMVRGDLVFVGFGRDDDYQGVDVTDKIVLSLRGMPDDTEDSVGNKATRAAQHGAKAILFIGPAAAGRSELPPIAPGFSCARADIVAAAVHSRFFRGWTGLDFEAARKNAGQQSKATGQRLRLITETEPQVGLGRNVLAKLPGKDPKATGTIVVGAHFDHLGIGETSSRTGHDAIHFGADDNASGTVTVLEMARVMAKQRQNQRTIYFQFYSGEELGLLGSRAFVDKYPEVVKDVWTMVNLDMVGRLRAEGLTIFGTGTAAPLDGILDAAQPGDLKLNRIVASPPNSDHASFVGRRIPSLFFNTGLHPEYHTEADQVGTINVQGMASVGDYVLRVLYQLDKVSAPMDFTGTVSASGPSGDPSRPRRVRFGVQPDMSESGGEGLLVNGVTTDSPAAKGGVKPGDLLISIAGRPVKTVQDLQEILVSLKAGEPVTVVVKRDGKEVTLTVTPEAPNPGN